MQRTAGDRTSHVLMVGLNREQGLEQSGNMKSSLQSMHMGWKFTSNAVHTAEEALQQIKECERIEVVAIYPEEAGWSKDETRRVAEVLAKALSEHPHKPWVFFEIFPGQMMWNVFIDAGLIVKQGWAESVISDRWMSQIPEHEGVS